MGDNNLANKILEDLNDRFSLIVTEKKLVVEEFLEKLRNEIANRITVGPLHGSTIMHAGSSFEHLVVKEKVDFDVIVLLGRPFVSENFFIERDYVTSFFALRWKPSVPCGTSFKDKGDYLKAQKLQNFVFKQLINLIHRIRLTKGSVRCQQGLAALDVVITCHGGTTISIDLGPQICCRSWGQCPDLRPLGELPVSLRRHIDLLNKEASPVLFFSPCVPTRCQRQPNSHRLCNISFSQIEKKFLSSNTNIRDMVRLVKLVAEKWEWKSRYYLKSFHLKRVAIKHSDELGKLGLWDGYKELLRATYRELDNETIDGFFLQNQETFKNWPQKIGSLQQEIVKARELTPSQLHRL